MLLQLLSVLSTHHNYVSCLTRWDVIKDLGSRRLADPLGADSGRIFDRDKTRSSPSEQPIDEQRRIICGAAH
eukprot:COSAG02_NODE_66819_length_254_cov_0.993548_1_plen_71_part_10